jgi:hypothetical protein
MGGRGRAYVALGESLLAGSHNGTRSILLPACAFVEEVLCWSIHQQVCPVL